ncbi:hypothetical protein BV898_06201 [Hypsibius exemplaris]|uniref:Uncharacterized protein n=1 Tax=Hypsibius exemplaris TaxID=2072580 RepID=A0A1W0WXJ9_HYPEX|nr:hypothetical protein BV898_06201 [Hypsibius exemplaris]
MKQTTGVTKNRVACKTGNRKPVLSGKPLKTPQVDYDSLDDEDTIEPAKNQPDFFPSDQDQLQNSSGTLPQTDTPIQRLTKNLTIFAPFLDCKFQCATSSAADRSGGTKGTTHSRRYNLHEFRKLNLDIKLGGLGSNRGPNEEAMIQRQSRVKEMTQAWRKRNEKAQADSDKRIELRRKSEETKQHDGSASESGTTGSCMEQSAAVAAGARVLPVVKLARLECLKEVEMKRAKRERARRERARRERDALLRQRQAALTKSGELERLAGNQLETLNAILSSEMAGRFE